jgi:hypothetical protein
MRRSEARQALAVSTDEDRLWLVMAEPAFLQQLRQCSHQIPRNGNNTISTSLTVEQHLRTPSLQVEVTRVDADRFGHAGAGSRQEEQKSPIAPTSVRRLIRGGDNGIDLRIGEVVRHLDVGPLGGDCQNALGDTERSRIVGCDVMEEGSNSGKAGIPRCYRVAPLLLKLVEKGEDEVPI